MAKTEEEVVLDEHARRAPPEEAEQAPPDGDFTAKWKVPADQRKAKWQAQVAMPNTQVMAAAKLGNPPYSGAPVAGVVRYVDVPFRQTPVAQMLPIFAVTHYADGRTPLKVEYMDIPTLVENEWCALHEGICDGIGMYYTDLGRTQVYQNLRAIQAAMAMAGACPSADAGGGVTRELAAVRMQPPMDP